MLTLVRFLPEIRLPNLFGTLAMMESQRRERLALRHLDRHLLDDVGLTRVEALGEARRSIFDLGPRW